MNYLATYVQNSLVDENTFRVMPRERSVPPSFAASKHVLPQPFWSNHDQAVECYWRVWELAFKHIRRPTAENGFVANYIDTAFNDNLFMWDSAFILLFARYGSRAFNFQRTLDNLYCKQHPDGFICREIRELDGSDLFHRFDPASTGPNVMPWTEWEYYQVFGDRDRLARVFPVLVAYHQWLRTYRTWPDGSYWTSGWGCGMDNQPRVPVMPRTEAHQTAWWSHGHMTWVDACLQQILSARLLLRMAGVLDRTSEMDDFQAEDEQLSRFVNDRLWDDQTAFYYDRRRDGELSDVKIIGAFWSLLADVVPPDRLAALVAHLENPAEFNRPHRVPTLSADHPDYQADGGYWLGGVWPPTNYMILRGLSKAGYDTLAHDIAMNHLDNVVKVFEKTGTVWENLAPESAAPGNPAKPDFVGWGGLPPTAVLFEYVFGLRPDFERGLLTWDVRLLDDHGVTQYPFGREGLLDLKCLRRRSQSEKPIIEAVSNVALDMHVLWDGGREVLHLEPRSTTGNHRRVQ